MAKKQTTIMLSEATQTQVSYLSNFGGTSDIIALAVDRMYVEELRRNTQEDLEAFKAKVAKFNEGGRLYSEYDGADHSKMENKEQGEKLRKMFLGYDWEEIELPCKRIVEEYCEQKPSSVLEFTKNSSGILYRGRFIFITEKKLVIKILDLNNFLFIYCK
jgi:hypothetical protein